jgi:3-hydroxymyristoyl/3-hydroxydecanoyl-(acyl carrier protein) dehydratase
VLPARVAPKTAIYDHEKILAYAVGNPSEAFGAKYKIFDQDRVIARLPGPPYEFVDRVTEVVGEPWELKAGCGCQTQYQIPVDAWYFAQNRQTIMPFCILLEIVLQPCGWLAAYAGSALTSKTDLSFRNLGGKATQYKEITNTSGLLQMDVTMTNVSLSGGMIIQRYEMAVTGESGMVYAGYTEFGFFSKMALAQQLGVQGATLYIPTTTEMDSARSFKYPIAAPFADTMLQMIDEIEIYLPHGGSNALGFIRGNKLVDPDEWFFKAHFYQDPVNPGSLGLEAFIQLIKVVAADKFDLDGTATLCSVAIGHEHEWIYRGQVLPTNKNVVVEAVITEIDLNNKFIKADGYYVVDDIVIYQMKNFTLTAE